MTDARQRRRAVSLFTWLRATWRALLHRTPPRDEAPPSLESDIHRMLPHDGHTTDWLTLDERHCLDRLTAAGLAERDVVQPVIGLHLRHRVRINTGMLPLDDDPTPPPR